jgi:hypothetical protein
MMRSARDMLPFVNGIVGIANGFSTTRDGSA